MKRSSLIAGGVTIIVIAVASFALRDSKAPGTLASAKSRAETPSRESPGVRVAARPSESRPAPGARFATSAAARASAPLPPLDAPVAAFLPELKSRALAGDPRAACRLAYELPRCFFRTGKADFAKTFRARAADMAKTPEARERASRLAAKYEARGAKDDAACKDVDLAEYNDTWKYALIAAHAGDLETAVRFAGFPHGMGLRLNSPAGQLDGWTAWRENAADFILRGVEAGMPAAVEAARFSYVSAPFGHPVFEKDPVRALAHAHVLAQYASDGYRRAAEMNIDYIAKEYGVSEADRARARALSVDIAAKLAKAGRVPGEVDFNEGTYANADASYCN